MRVNRPVWPVIAMIFVGMATDAPAIVILGIMLGTMWLLLEMFDGEVP
jgi:ABC-type transport system involved in cytochrome c biogenesis permease subunit